MDKVFYNFEYLIKRAFFICYLLLSFNGYSQSSEGNRFWLAYMENLPLFANDDPVFRLHVDADISAEITVSLPANGWSQTYVAIGGELTVIDLPSDIFYTIGSEVVDDFGFLIEATNPVKISTIHNRAFFSESSLLLPESSLGTEYLITCYEDDGDSSPTAFVVVATTDNAEVEITPSATTLGGRTADLPFTVTLDRGQTFQVKSDGDLTGSRVRSISGAPLGVFAGAQQASVFTCGQPNADNHLYEQQWPVSDWSDLFYFVPFRGQGGDVVRIIAAGDNSTVFFDCNEIVTLDAGDYYTGKIVAPTVISTTSNVAVYQLNESQACNSSGIGDPNMVQVLPIRDKSQTARFWAPDEINGLGSTYFTRHFVNVVTRTEDVSLIQLNGNSIAEEFESFDADPDWSFARIQLSRSGVHSLNSAAFFQACSYGFGNFDAYATSLGHESKEEESFICLEVEVEGLFCVDSVLEFSTVSNLEISSWDWNFGDGTISDLSVPSHIFTSPGSYTITVEVEFVNGGNRLAFLTLEIFDCPADPCINPSANTTIQFDPESCLEEGFTFTYTTDINVTSQLWDFGNGFTSSSEVATANYNSTGNYTVTLTLFDTFNCATTSTIEINVFNCDPCAQAGFVEVSIIGELCVGSSVILPFPIDINLDANPLLSFRWLVNGEEFTDPSPIINLEDEGPLVV